LRPKHKESYNFYKGTEKEKRENRNFYNKPEGFFYKLFYELTLLIELKKIVWW
jgi:hypothetical protein